MGLNRGVRLGFERTAEQDVAFGVRQLADIASKALSPAVNDPYTAVQAVDHLSVILAALATKPLGNQILTDGDGTPRVHIPARDWAYFIDLGLGQVRRFGHTEPRVVLALLRVARDLGTLCHGPRRTSLREYVRFCSTTSNKTSPSQPTAIPSSNEATDCCPTSRADAARAGRLPSEDHSGGPTIRAKTEVLKHTGAAHPPSANRRPVVRTPGYDAPWSIATSPGRPGRPLPAHSGSGTWPLRIGR